MSDGRLIVELSGLDRLWALAGGVDVALTAVTGVRPLTRAEAAARAAGWRLPGTAWPGLIQAGTYVSRANGRSFWCVHRAQTVLLIDLVGEKYDHLVLEVDDPHAVSRQLARARFN